MAVKRLGHVGQLIDFLIELYNKDEIEGLVVCIKHKDETFGHAMTTNLDHLTVLGLLEATKAACSHMVLCPDC